MISTVAHAAETAEAIYAKAYGNIYKNNTSAAIRILEKGLATYPDCAFLYAGLGDAYLKEGNYDKALDYYTNAQRKKYALDNYKIDFYNANLQKTMSDISNGINSLFVATKNTDNTVVYRNINSLLNEDYMNLSFITDMYLNTADEALNNINNLKNSGKKEEAVKSYLQLLSANPKNFQVANNLGVTLFELKDYQLAEKYLKTALENNKESAIIYNNLAIVQLYLKNYKDMETNFNEALKYNSEYFPAINNKVIAKIRRDLELYQPQNANTLLDIAKKDNENYYALRTLAKIYFVRGDFASANNILKPLNSTYNFKLYTQKAYTAYKNYDLDNALTYINKAISLYSDNSIDYSTRGRIYTDLGRYNEAKNDFAKALNKDKKNYMVYYYQAKMFNKAGDTTSSHNALTQFVSLKRGNTKSSNLSLLLN
ncbi:MAG: tetratricopeptide repeat protein [Candidatus Gastranaerophilales bacterium]|nr:tetratricopeptide repeat protein [Candidatus Gastranaerophilales bacterium]